MRRLAFIVPIVLFLMVAAALGLGLRRDPSILPSMLIDRPIPTFDLPGLTPEDTVGLASSDFTGKPVLLNVFASWCVACVIEHPMLNSCVPRCRRTTPLSATIRAAHGKGL